jgi:dTDP-glucose 4,6-dehydratase
MSKKILVTGGAGFIGSNFIRYMLDTYTDYKVVNLDKLNYAGRRENLKDVEGNPRYKFVRGDICDEKVVAELVKDCDTIVNFAAQTHVDRSIDDASEFVRTNVYGTYVLLEAARKRGNLRYIQISTDEVYGSRKEGFFKEDDALRPSSPYSASKAAADLLTHSYFVTYNLPVVIVRSTNNFGPYQFPEKVIPLFITNALRGRRLPVYGKGENIRNWIYVLDNCRAIDFVMHKGKTGEVYNIAGTTEINNMELTRLILKIMNKPEELIEFVRDRPGHDWRYAVDNSKLKALGWKARYDFEQALKETIKWYEKQGCVPKL